MSQPFWSGNALSSAAYFRPLVLLSFRFDAWLYAGNAVGFHLTNLLVHTANAVLLALLARRQGARALTACAAALGFAWAPRLTESVAWVSGRTDVLATFFVLIALLLWPLRRIGPALSALALGLGVLSKEVALAGALAQFLLEWRAGNALATRAQRLAPLVIVTVGALGWRGLVLRNAPAVSDGLSFQARLLSATETLGDYLGMLFDPWQPSLQIGWLGSPRAPALGLGFAALLLLALGAFRLRRSRPGPLSVSTRRVGHGIARRRFAPRPLADQGHRGRSISVSAHRGGRTGPCNAESAAPTTPRKPRHCARFGVIGRHHLASHRRLERRGSALGARGTERASE